MKLVLASNANSSHFHLLDELVSDGVTVVMAFDEQTLRREIVDADGLYGFPSAEALNLATKLRWVQSSSAGVERLWDLPALQNSEVVVTNARGAHAVNMAEHVFAMILAYSRGILVSREHQKQHRWEARVAREYCYELAGSTMVILGFGNIGRQVAKRARAFDMNVIAVDAVPSSADDPAIQVWPLERLDDALSMADIVVVAAPATPESRHTINAARLRTHFRTHAAWQIPVQRAGAPRRTRRRSIVEADARYTKPAALVAVTS